ncbi:3D (Asp-Asp-Asp) domain-containing protein [Thermodesulfitimonas autotrophica]|uniref:3D (Asp-Asp-Asp) domain-containing protein n=1 Tax=Thermodesulfitimonas autotrophica TaxID=1894989 RepID=A0A3N5BUQ1_9THEO|nr:3D domain-containing protein [Thermodesulfitimonas autotrophica]RPF49615.1 3D (Asp-Asp-Asp) domain-containing protein [Thermodesulfitimonas autotrophica]
MLLLTVALLLRAGALLPGSGCGQTGAVAKPPNPPGLEAKHPKPPALEAKPPNQAGSEGPPRDPGDPAPRKVSCTRSELPDRGASRVVRVVATGYTAGYESTGKRPGDPGYGITRSGLPAARGACAVDPDVIPLGSVLFVPGYGYAVALDTGGAIKGNRIDLFFPEEREALAWGRRAVQVFIVAQP